MSRKKGCLFSLIDFLKAVNKFIFFWKSPGRCEECKVPIARRFYEVKVDNNKMIRVCPNCAKRYKRIASKIAQNGG